MRLEEFFNFNEKTPAEQRRRNKPRDVLGNRPAAREGSKANFTNKDTVRGYKYLMSDKVRTNDPDHAEEKKRLRKQQGFGTGPVGKLPENYNKENGMMDLKKMFEMAGVDITQGKAKKLMEQDSLLEAKKFSLAMRNDPSQYADAVKLTTSPPHNQVFVVADRSAQDGEEAFNTEFFDSLAQVSELAADTIADNPELFAFDPGVDLNQYPAGRIYMVPFDELVRIAASRWGKVR